MLVMRMEKRFSFMIQDDTSTYAIIPPTRTSAPAATLRAQCTPRDQDAPNVAARSPWLSRNVRLCSGPCKTAQQHPYVRPQANNQEVACMLHTRHLHGKAVVSPYFWCSLCIHVCIPLSKVQQAQNGELVTISSGQSHNRVSEALQPCEAQHASWRVLVFPRALHAYASEGIALGRSLHSKSFTCPQC